MKDKRPNILFLLSDEHSFRFMGHCSQEEGGEPVHTPTFDKLAAEGTVFSNTYCQMPLCTPSRISLLTGLHVTESGAWNNSSVLSPRLTTLPDVLSKNGYETCLVGKMHLGGTRQFVGFKSRPYGDLTGGCGHQWEPLENKGSRGMRGRTADAGVSEVPESLIQDQIVCHESLAFIREQQAKAPEKSWMLCASFSRPHFPYTVPARHFNRYWPDNITPPKVPASGDAYDHPMSVGMREGFMADAVDEEEMMKARAAYAGCVTYLDEIIGDFFARLERDGLLDNTIIVYTSDHGELAGEHGVWYKNGWYEGCTRVPFIISTPEQRRNEEKASVVETPAALIDLFPTLCSMASCDIPDGLAGRDLSSVVRENKPLEAAPVFCDALIPRWGKGTEFRMIRYKDYKYVRFRNLEPLFFDLKNDPGEQRNIVDDDLEPEASEIRGYLEKLAADSIDFDESERIRMDRDGSLHQEYKQNLPGSTGNLYLMPSGKLINADDCLYNPTIIANEPGEAFIDHS